MTMHTAAAFAVRVRCGCGVDAEWMYRTYIIHAKLEDGGDALCLREWFAFQYELSE